MFTAIFLLLTLILYTCPVTSRTHQHVVTKELELNDINTLIQSLATSQDSAEDEEDIVSDLAEVQGVFNILAQVKNEQAKSTGRAMTQIWGLVGSRLLRIGKKILRRKYCEEEQKVMLQELMEEQSEADEQGNLDDDAELQTFFDALNKLQAERVQDNIQNAAAQGWFKRLFKKIGRGLKKFLKKTVW